MELIHRAMAGTLESSDAQVTVEPSDALTITIESSVKEQFGRQIQESAEEVLKNLEVSKGKIRVEDKGALDCTLRSRVQTAIFRSIDQTSNLPWGVKL